MTFGEKIQKLRKEAAMSQEELAYQLDVSRQAVSKWERDNGYPETEKIVRMSKLFSVSLDYLLNEEDSEKPEIGPEERGLYVSRETANGFLAYHKRKMMKVGAAVGLFIGSLSLAFWDAEINMIIFMAVVILALILLISVRLADDPYSRLWKESLVFDKAVKSELAFALCRQEDVLAYSEPCGSRSDCHGLSALSYNCARRNICPGQRHARPWNGSGRCRRLFFMRVYFQCCPGIQTTYYE